MITHYQEKKTLSKSDIILVVFLLTFFLSNTLEKQIRHVFYLLPIVVLFLDTHPIQRLKSIWKNQEQQLLFLRHFLFITLGIIAYSSIMLLIRQDSYSRFFKESIFILTPILFIYYFWHTCNKEHLNRYAKFIFWGIAITYFVAINQQLLQLFEQESFVDNSILLSNMPTEHFSSFLFGFCCLYFLQSRQWMYTILAFLLTLLSFKRIAIGGVILTGFVWCILPFLQKLIRHKVLIMSFIVFIHVVFIWLMMTLSSFRYDKEIIQLTGISTQGLSSGRMKTFTAVLEETDGISLWGYGLGKTSQILEDKQHYLSLIHSDIFKLVIELGLIGSSCWLCLFYWPFLANPRQLIFPIYLNFLFFTDNTFIYFEILTVFYLFVMISMKRDEVLPTNQSTT